MPEPLILLEQVRISASLKDGQFGKFKSAYQGAPGQKSKRICKYICKDVGEALVASSNIDGDDLLIGAEDDGVITGVNDFNEEEIDRIKNAAITHGNCSRPWHFPLI